MQEYNRVMNSADGRNGNLGYSTMLVQNWLSEDQSEEHKEASNMRICICVRK